MAYKNEDDEEILFQKSLLKFHSIESCRSTGDIDRVWHVDVFTGTGWAVDVKKQKKIHFYDKQPSMTHTWIEYRNNFGKKGWLYGRATHIAFAHRDHYLLVNRKDLVEYAEKLAVKLGLMISEDEFVITPREKGTRFQPYKIYSKTGNDKVMLVHLHDFRRLRTITVKRDIPDAG